MSDDRQIFRGPRMPNFVDPDIFADRTIVDAALTPIVIAAQADADRLFGPGAFRVPSQRTSVFVRVPASCDSDPTRRTTSGSVTLVVDDMPVRDVTRIKIEEA